MVKASVNTVAEYDKVIESIQKNYHLLVNSNESKYYKFNNRMLISGSKPFLSAVKEDIGGEIINDKAIGSFLYFGTEG